MEDEFLVLLSLVLATIGISINITIEKWEREHRSTIQPRRNLGERHELPMLWVAKARHSCSSDSGCHYRPTNLQATLPLPRKRAKRTDIKVTSLAQTCRRDKAGLQIGFDGFGAALETVTGFVHGSKGHFRKTEAYMID